MPTEAAPPFGLSSYQWFMLEVHFNNPGLDQGVVDEGSGMELTYTPHLRPHDMGLLTIMQSALEIPPGRTNFSAPTSHCLPSCTRRFKQPVNLVDQAFHMHGIGHSAITRRWRGGQELKPQAHVRRFDYNHQGFTPVAPDARVLRPGDALALTCTFDSTSRTNVTRNGQGTEDEMCFYWAYYWPKQDDMGVCASAPPRDSRPAMGLCAADLSALRNARDPAQLLGLMGRGLVLPVLPGPSTTGGGPFSRPWQPTCNAARP